MMTTMIDLVRSVHASLSPHHGASLAMALTCAVVSAGCEDIEKAPPQAKPAHVAQGFALDVPEIMRGTVGSETVLRGYQAETSPGYKPIVVRGYGLVVGLKGTGSRDMVPQLRQYMIQEAQRGGFGSEKFGESIAAMTPEALLNSPNTAVVIVEAVMPQGAPAGTRFDVRVYSEPSTSTTSLEGGTLYTTLLRPGPPAMGGQQAFELARAYGPVFINPFAGPTSSSDVMKTAGRILNGGEVIKDMPLKLQLANPSHSRAAILQSAINARFPREPGQHDDTARGESDELIDLCVPPSWADRTEEWVKLLMHTTISQANPEAVSMYVKRTLLTNPSANGEAAALRWQALGPRALPLIKDLYDHPEELPRLSALVAGAKLDDGLVIPHLVDMADGGSTTSRLTAITLLESMRSNPSIDTCLRKLLNDDDVEIRLRAYEALVKRADPFMDRYNVDGKFVLDVIKSDKPLIYVTQVGQPRIAVFGNNLELDRPLTVSVWSNQLMLKGDSDQQDIEVYYRVSDEDSGVILRSKPGLPDFVQFLAHKTSIESPAPGLNMTYGETVGALQQIWRQKRINADFKMEQDRILEAIRRVNSEGAGEAVDRPEFSSSPTTAPAHSDIGRLNEAPTPSNSTQSLPGTQQPKKPGG